uniref:glycoside hydrolase family 95 protein n=1 Tax=Pedobacter schmidteae TaxID=2201271 RepID=UPI000EAFFAD3|nr:glycoside hydrolase family 95 protein [Pedobacter schmidteae]
MKKISFCLFITIFTQYAFAQQKPLKLWYTQPAALWEETLPLGNGRLGMMPDGGVIKENIVLNDITLWSGTYQDANNYQAHQSLPQIRKLLLEGKNDEAQALVNKAFICTGEGSGRGNGANVPFGCYQTLGNLVISHHQNQAKDSYSGYSRRLSLDSAIATSQYQLNGVTYTREYLTSFDNDVCVVRLTASKAKSLNFTIGLNRAERYTVKTTGNQLQMSGQLNNGTDGKGMKYLTLLEVKSGDGKIVSTGTSLTVSNASEAIIYLSAGTDFKNYGFLEKTASTLNAAMAKPYSLLKKNHIAKYQKLFNRVALQMHNDKNDQPTNERLIAFNKGTNDNGLLILYYQFGRYLSISSTRPGLLPPNLQGLWANQIQTPWNGDYHLDVNVQMNHWPLEVSNLSELSLPLADLVKELVKPGEKTAKAYYDAKGWVAHVVTNVWGFTEPGEDASWGATNSGSGWLCNNLWEHYAFTNDKKYLKEIYPILKGAAEFYNSVLTKENANGWLVTSPSVSPENNFYLPNGKIASLCMGPTIDNQIVRELFNNVITASQTLNIDNHFRTILAQKLTQLPPAAQVAKDGRIMEWLEEYKEAEPQHRHISHLYGLYPANLITPDHTPELAKASMASLNARGDKSTGWSEAYKILFWARLKDGNRAFKVLKQLLFPVYSNAASMNYDGGSYANLFCACPPFQIDGNFGGTAGIAEMLIQSNQGYIELLPAIPDEWKKSGEVKGLKARGNFVVDMTWKDGRITAYKISSPEKKKVKVKVNGIVKEIKSV